MRKTLLAIVALTFAATLSVYSFISEKRPVADADKEEVHFTHFNPNFHIYLALGQSNMEGNAAIEDQDRINLSPRFVTMAVVDMPKQQRKSGSWYKACPPLCRENTGLTPLDYFGRTLAEALPDSITIGVIDVALGGCSIDMFIPDSLPQHLPKQPDWLRNFAASYNNDPFRALVEAGRAAQKVGVIKGILLHQGETNNGQKDWPRKVAHVYTRLLQELNLDARQVPLLAGEMLSKAQGGVCHGHNSVIATLPNVIPTAHVVSSQGCPGKPDGLHFTAEGYRILGRHYADIMLQCLKASEENPAYKDTKLSAHERAVDLCSRLTLDEKAKLMLDDSPAIPRLGIKHWQWWSEALHGYANMGHVTNFPEPIGMAASFNDDMVYRVFDAVSTEARAKWNELQAQGGDVTRFHALSVWTPNVNIFRDPRWGRGQETYGEDPFLTSRMGCAVVRGLQGPEDSKYRKLWACAKHYAVHSGPEWSRHTADINNISMRDLWETYLPAFKTLVEDAKVREVMCAYQRYDNEPCCSSGRLLQDILRDEWGFKYLVVSDCGAVTDIHANHKVASDATHSAARATLAGTDVECGFNYAYKSIPEAVRRGLISEKEVDKHVVRLLEGRFDLGEMDDPSLVEWSNIPTSVLESKAHLDLALDMARQTIVLLKNDETSAKPALPLAVGEKVAVIGPNADNKSMMWGNYNGTPTTTLTILDGMRAINKKVRYMQACDLTDNHVVTPLFDQCAWEGKRGMKGTFWNNADRSGKPVATAQYTAPFFKTTAGNYQFAPGVNLTDFSATYETVFTPKESGEVVLNVESVSRFEVLVNGESKVRHATWRVTPTRTVIQAEAGKEYKIEIRFAHMPTYGASIRVNIGRESIINYQDVVDQLKDVNTVVFAGGIAPSLEGEEMPVNIDGFRGGDRTNIDLPAVQRGLLKALKEAGKKVIFVNCSGSAIALQEESKWCDAIVQAWYPGQQGGTAVAEVLYGRVNPSGKLPVTFYATSQQLGDFEDYNMEGRTYRYMRKDTPLYPFGHGLSYTTFSLGDASLSASAIDRKEGKVTLTVPVSNTGLCEGTEVVQVYLRNPQDPTGPVKQLRAYQRVALKKGESGKANIELTSKSFEWFDDQTNTIHVRPGRYELLYGTSSANEKLKSIAIEVK